MQTDIVVIKLDKARALLSEAKTIQDTKKIVDIAASAEIFARRQKLGDDAVHYATEIKLEALRQLGEMLKATERASGGAIGGKKKIDGTRKEPSITEPTLAELGLDKKISKLAQDVAALPVSQFELVRAGAIRLSEAQKEVRAQARRDAPIIQRSILVDVTTIHGDMLEVLQGLEPFDLVVADPPYNVTDLDWDEIGDRRAFIKQSREWLMAITKVINPQFNLFWFCSPRFSADIEMVIRDIGLPIQSRIVWHRRNMSMGSQAKNKFVDSWEMIFHCGTRLLNFPPDWSEAWFDVQTHAAPQTNFDDSKMHPTQKPLSLISRLVEFGSFEGDRILDPFAGSGTTGRASIGRHCTLVERDDEYYNLLVRQFGVSK